MYVSAGICLLMGGCVLPMGVASMRTPVMVSTLERQVSVKEVSFTSEIRTRRGGLTSALRRKGNSMFTVVDYGTDWKCVDFFCTSYLPVWLSLRSVVCW